MEGLIVFSAAIIIGVYVYRNVSSAYSINKYHGKPKIFLAHLLNEWGKLHFERDNLVNRQNHFGERFIGVYKKVDYSCDMYFTYTKTNVKVRLIFDGGKNMKLEKTFNRAADLDAIEETCFDTLDEFRELVDFWK